LAKWTFLACLQLHLTLSNSYSQPQPCTGLGKCQPILVALSQASSAQPAFSTAMLHGQGQLLYPDQLLCARLCTVPGVMSYSVFTATLRPLYPHSAEQENKGQTHKSRGQSPWTGKWWSMSLSWSHPHPRQGPLLHTPWFLQINTHLSVLILSVSPSCSHTGVTHWPH
jgi:hypothetical protein